MQAANEDGFLSEYTQSFNLINQAASFFNSFVKNIHSQYIAVSHGFLELSAPDLIDVNIKNLYDKNFEAVMLKNTELFAETIRKQDEKVLAEAKPYSFLHIHSATELYVVHKCPIINPKTGVVVGIMGYMEKFMAPNLLQVIAKINGIKLDSIDYGVKPGTSLTYDLTEKQHMVLFLVVYKYSFTEISEIMTKLGYQMSSSRVNGHIENLKYIFNVQSKEALTEKAILLKYHMYLPKKFVKIGSYDLDDNILVSS